MTAQEFDRRLADQTRIQQGVSADMRQKRSSPRGLGLPKSEQKDTNTMAGEIQQLTFLKRSELPVMRVGAEGTTAVSVGENGQFRFSSKVSAVAKHYKYANAPANIGTDRRLDIYLVKDVPKGQDIKDWFELRQSEKSENDTIYFSGIGICRRFEYDNKASGTHAYDATVQDGKKHPQLGAYCIVSFTLPKGVQAATGVKRTRRTKTEIAAAKAAKHAATMPTPNKPNGADNGIDLSAPE
jgi:hypothetical protein